MFMVMIQIVRFIFKKLKERVKQLVCSLLNLKLSAPSILIYLLNEGSGDPLKQFNTYGNVSVI